MSAAKQIINRMIEELSDDEITKVVSYIAFIKNERQNQYAKNLEQAALTSTGFWDNSVDDEVWDNV